MSEESSAMDLRSVVQRFSDSSEALEQLRERLRRLAEAEDAQVDAADSINEARDQLRRLTGELENEIAVLSAATAETRSAMAAATEFLQGTDLKLIRDEITRLGSAQDDLRSSNSQIAELLEHDLASARTEASQAVEARRQLEAKVAALPEKTRRKFGL
jgi:hypothetical protein